MKAFHSIAITGASSGIGAALAVAYARPGVHLALTGRDETRLAAVGAACQAAGAAVEHRSLDVRDGPVLAAWLQQVDVANPLDLLIANAGVCIEPDPAVSLDEATARLTYAVNVEGVFNTVFPILPQMRARRAGQIALMSSLAAFVGRPVAAAYNGSKAAVRVWGESLRHALRGDGVGVSVICPGYVDTPLNSRTGEPRPMLINTAEAVHAIMQGLAHNRGRIAFPLNARTAMWANSMLPAALAEWLAIRRGR